MGNNGCGAVTFQAVFAARGPVVGEAILPLRVDGWKDGFAVDLKSSPQGLSDLLSVFARQPPGLCADADAPAVFVVLGGPAQVIPGALGTDSTQVGAICLDAFVNSLLLEKNQRARVPSENRGPSHHCPPHSHCTC